MLTTEGVYDLATKIYLEGNTRLQAALGALDPKETDALGITSEQHREQVLQRAIEAAASDLGLTAWGYMLALIERSGVDIQHLRQQIAKEEAGAIGLDRLI